MTDPKTHHEGRVSPPDVHLGDLLPGQAPTLLFPETQQNRQCSPRKGLQGEELERVWTSESTIISRETSSPSDSDAGFEDNTLRQSCVSELEGTH